MVSMAYTSKDGGDLASFEGKYPKDLFNKSVVASDNQNLIGYVPNIGRIYYGLVEFKATTK